MTVSGDVASLLTLTPGDTFNVLFEVCDEGAGGTLDTTELGGVVRYSTPVEFSGEGANYPSAGSLLVEGSNSSARLTAVDDVNVTIEVDSNGDGVIDDTINTTWAVLAGS